MKSGLQGLDEKLANVDRMLREDYGEGIQSFLLMYLIGYS